MKELTEALFGFPQDRGRTILDTLLHGLMACPWRPPWIPA